MRENGNPITLKEEKQILELREIIETQYTALVQSLEKKISAFSLGVQNTLIPTDYNKIAAAELSSFARFLKEKDTAFAAARGIAASVSGYSEQFVLSFFDHFYLLFSEYSPNKSLEYTHFIHNIVYQYTSALSLAYIRSQYKYRNKEQEQLYAAVIESNSEKQIQIIHLQQERIKAVEAENEMRTLFMVNFAHETKTPLTLIKNDITNVKREAAGNELPSLPVLEENVEKYIEMTDNILATEQILKGKMLYIHSTIINISKLTARKIELFGNILRENHVRMVQEIRENLYTRIAVNAFDQILNNIIANAIKFNRENGLITVSLKEENNLAVLAVSDTGIGIPKDQMEHLYEPYYQMARQQSVKGIGAGLTIVKGIVDEVKASIQITSEENHGTTVKIAFKCAQPLPEDTVIDDVELPIPVRKKRMNYNPPQNTDEKPVVLVVEDEFEMFERIIRQGSKKFHFILARDGAEAYTKLKTVKNICLIITDIRMAGMDGITFFNFVKEIEEYRDIPFIFITGKESETEKLEILKAGAIAYFIKPFNVDELIHTMGSQIKVLAETRRDEADHVLKEIAEHVAKRRRGGQTVSIEDLFKQYEINPREKDVIISVLEGLTTEKIAERLFISPRTVQTHLTNIYDKCVIHSKPELIKLFTVKFI